MSNSGSSSSRSRAGQAGLQPALDAVLREPAGDTLRRALWLEAVDRELRPKLPVPLAGHVRVANVVQGCLSLRANGPVWASRARFHGEDILLAARSIGLTVVRVEVRVATASAPPTRAPEKPASPASRAAVADAIKLLQDEG